MSYMNFKQKYLYSTTADLFNLNYSQRSPVAHNGNTLGCATEKENYTSC